MTIIREYGLRWIAYRSLYVGKLKMLNLFPVTEKLFERKVEINRIDIFHIDTGRIEKFLLCLPEEEKKEIIQYADNVLEGKIIGFSNIMLEYGTPMNWQLNPVSGKNTDKTQKWYSISDFDPERGDIKLIWEASRFGYLFFVLRAYMLTKEIKYYEGFSKIITHWLEENQYSYGANFKCGQECTLRMMNTLAVYAGFASYGVTTEQDETNVMKIVESSYKKVCSNFFYAYKCIKNDHTIAELCGMIIGAWCSSDLKKCQRYFRKLDLEIAEQFSNSGMYLSYSFNYQRYVLQLMEYMLKVSEQLGVSFSEETRQILYNAALLLYQSQSDDGRVPNYGANDGTLIFPLTVCGFRNYMPIIHAITCLIKGETYYQPGAHEEELLWFSNAATKVKYREMVRKTLYNTETGVYHYRKDKVYMFINAHNYERRPGHMDQLHVDLWIGGKNVLCDSGTYSYAETDGEQLSSTLGHNTVCVDKKEQMRKIGKFMTYDIPCVKILKCEKNEFEASLKSGTGYIHNRYIKIEDNKIIFADNVVQSGKIEPWSIVFHTPFRIKQEADTILFFDENGKEICKLMHQAKDVEVQESFVSWYYMDKQSINLIKIKCLEDSSVLEIKVED